jgi:PST family polysaccharide transporter
MSLDNIEVNSAAPPGANPAGRPRGRKIDPAIDPNEEHLNTDHLRSNVKQRTISGSVITLTSQGAKFALNVGSTIILARLLAPHDFGLLAMVTTIIGLLRFFKDAGLSAATVQREGITHAQVSNLFWINTGVGGLLALIMAAGAPVIAWFYREPSLLGITLWLSFASLLDGPTVQHQALLRRQMRFKALALIEVGSMLVSLIVGVTMALCGCGYWSLVGQNLGGEGSALVFTWLASRWRPQLPRRHSGTRQLLGFGVSIAASGTLYSITRSVDSMLIGWRYGPDAIGLYSRALALLMRPLDQLLTPFGAVLMPTLSRLQGEPERYRRVFLRLFEALALVSFVSTGLLFALSRPIALVLLGPKWEAVGVIFAGLSLVALYLPITAPVSWLLMSLGRSQDFLRWNTAYAVITVASFFVGLPFGAVGVAYAYSIGGMMFALPIVFYMAGRSGPVRTKDLWAVFFRQLPLWAVVAGAAFLARTWAARFSPLTQLFICAPIGLAAAFVSVLVIKPQREVAEYILDSFRGMLAARRKAQPV